MTEKNLMQRKLVALAALALLSSGGALAQARTAAPEPEYTYSFNVGAVTDYRYRGISQSRLRPALQGGADFSHASGFYVGTWASSIRWIDDAGGNANVEVDIYGGYKTSFNAVGIDVGVLRYLYPNSQLPVSPNTTELYVAGTWGPATLKYSHATTNLFGFADSKNSGYLDLSATFDTGFWGLTVTPHVGHQRVRNNSAFSYTDWSIGLGKDFGNGLTASLAYVDTDTDLYVAPNGRNLGRSGLVLGVKYGF
jgi:uncharacterized protein (TIGR02001 family)